ncbi:MAG: 2-C-methyl-D-erythritol 2,4-cyclodiphosphate synthase [Sphaerochaetaceae bacterium]|nr:2-C-methyl-D-erythritol 2,4-cyclodiphosphate synthase [Sphaerochaetaceae bacterium]
MKIGTGWDIHKLAQGRRLLLGGVEIPSDKGEVGHSDGDVLIHAIIDALFGAFALGDIGSHFPSDDAKWKDSDSMKLLAFALGELGNNRIVNIDSTIILQTPKLREHINAIRISLAEACALPLDRVSVKAKTAEHMLGELGTGDAICAQVVVLVDDGDETPERWA